MECRELFIAHHAVGIIVTAPTSLIPKNQLDKPTNAFQMQDRKDIILIKTLTIVMPRS